MDELNSDDIHMCRTCGVFYSNNFLRKIFNNPFDEVAIALAQRIRLIMSAWKVEINENDGRSEFLCVLCINEFERSFKFLDRCVDVHQEYTSLFPIQMDMIQVKKELPEEVDKHLGFIYIDGLSDDDDDQYEGSMVPCFDMSSHLAFKEENIEAARVPPPNVVQPVYLPNETDAFIPFTMMSDELQQDSIATTTIPFADMTNDNDKIKNDPQHNTFSIDNNIDSNNDDDINVVKFTYDDDIKDPYTNTIDIENKPVVGMSQDTTTLTTTTSLMCKLCLHVAADQAALREHFQRIHAVKDLECHICGKQFKNSTSSRLRYHLKWHKLNKHIQCVLCGFNCASRDILNEHKRAVHSKIQCNICNKKIYAKKMKGHLRAHELTAPPSFRCSICNELFGQQNVYESHMILAHVNVQDSQDEILNSTEIVTKISDGLEQHLGNKLSLQEESDPFNSFTSHSNIPDDTEEFDLNEDEEIDVFDTNNKTQQNQSYAQFRRQITTPPPTFTSPQKEEISMNDIVTTIINDAIFSLPKTPLKEQFNESANQTYTCAQCTEWFTSVDDLIDHAEMHKRNFFKCELCDKSFDLKFKLNRHTMKHHKDVMSEN